MPDFDNNGASVHYELVGAGPPLLCIAGLASDGASWSPLTPLLANRFRLILIDNRGSGRTKVEGPLSIADMVDDCAALLDRLEIPTAAVLGHSLGGTIGLCLAAGHSSRVTRLVTLGTGILTGKERTLLSDLARLYFTIAPADWFRLLYQWLFSSPFFASETSAATAAAASVAYPYRQSPGDFARQVAAIESMGALPLSRVQCPVLAIAAELDLMSPAREVEALHAPVPSHRIETIANVAHSMHWEAPEAVAKLVADFLG